MRFLNRNEDALVMRLAWPCVIENISATMVSLVDTAMVGSLGAVATAAVGVCASPSWLMNGLVQALGIGGTALVARAIGAMLRTWTGVQKKLFSSWGGPEPSEFVAFLHDPLTVQALVDASPLRFETLRIVPTIERGVLRTLEAPPAAGLGAEMKVATAVDATAARDVIVAGLAGL